MTYFICNICEAPLGRRDTLRNHRAIQHFGVRFVCHICGHAEKERYKLTNHFKDQHNFTNEFSDDMCRRILPTLATHPPDEREMDTKLHTDAGIHSLKECKKEIGDIDAITIIDDEESNHDDNNGEQLSGMDDESDSYVDVEAADNEKNFRRVHFKLPEKPGKMKWVVSSDNRILWNEYSHLALVKAIRDNLAVLNESSGDGDRKMAWQRIFKILEKQGMPICTMAAVQKTWARAKKRAQDNIKHYRHQKQRKVKSIEPLSRIDQAIHDLLEYYKTILQKNKGSVVKPTSTRTPPKARAPSAQSSPAAKNRTLRPRGRAMSMYVGDVPLDDDDDDEPQPSTSKRSVNEMIDKFTHLEKLQLRTAMPRIRLTPLRMTMTMNETRTPSTESLASSARITSTNETVPSPQPQSPQPDPKADEVKTLQQLQLEAAEHEIKLKQAQRQNEEERMEYERDIYRKQLNLLDLNIRKANLEIDALQGNGGNNHFEQEQLADGR